MLRQALILSSNREYAQQMRQGLLKLDEALLVNIETDPLRAMQLAPQQYDLILLDAMLGMMDGLQLLHFIKNQAPAGKFVIISDTSDESSRASAYQNGADFFLERPHTPEALGLALEAIKAMFRPRTGEMPSLEEPDNPPVGIVDVVQMHCLSGDSILLLVRSRQQSGDIFIYRGEVYHAQFPGRGGEAAFREMIHWDDGRVRVKTVKLTHSPPRTIEVPYRQLLGAADQLEPARPDAPLRSGDLLVVAPEASPEIAARTAIHEAPPRKDEPGPIIFPDPTLMARGETPLPQLNSHWKIALTGELVEGSRVSEPDRCAFITSFIYRKMADVAVALEVDYFDQITLFGPHLLQVLVADNLGVRQAVFDTVWTTEDVRDQYVKWCREQSF